MAAFWALLAAAAVLSAKLTSSVPDEESSALVALEGTAEQANISAAAGVQSSEEERGGCPGRCRCEVDGLLQRVDCSDLGLRELPSNLSLFTSYL